MEFTIKDIESLETKFNDIWRSLWHTKQRRWNKYIK